MQNSTCSHSLVRMPLMCCVCRNKCFQYLLYYIPSLTLIQNFNIIKRSLKIILTYAIYSQSMFPKPLIHYHNIEVNFQKSATMQGVYPSYVIEDWSNNIKIIWVVLLHGRKIWSPVISSEQTIVMRTLIIDRRLVVKKREIVL